MGIGKMSTEIRRPETNREICNTAVDWRKEARSALMEKS
jgi:hypothetical protein